MDKFVIITLCFFQYWEWFQQIMGLFFQLIENLFFLSFHTSYPFRKYQNYHKTPSNERIATTILKI